MEDWVRVSCYDISGVSEGLGVFFGRKRRWWMGR